MRNPSYITTAALAMATNSRPQQPAFHLHDRNRLLFYGDSVSDQRNYTMIIETYLNTHYLALKVEFAHSGWGSDRVATACGGDIDLRLKRNIVLTGCLSNNLRRSTQLAGPSCAVASIFSPKGHAEQ